MKALGSVEESQAQIHILCEAILCEIPRLGKSAGTESRLGTPGTSGGRVERGEEQSLPNGCGVSSCGDKNGLKLDRSGAQHCEYTKWH